MELRPWTLPNLLTLARLGALPFIILAILDGRQDTAVVIFLAAAVTDLLDGFVARRFGMTSPLGAYLDPITDKLFLISTYVACALPSTPGLVHIPLWLVILTISRDVLILLVALLMYLVLDVRSFPPSPLGKATTFVEISLVVAVLLVNLGLLPRAFTDVGVTVVAFFTVSSGLHYTWRVANLASPRSPRPAPPGAPPADAA